MITVLFLAGFVRWFQRRRARRRFDSELAEENREFVEDGYDEVETVRFPTALNT